LEFPGSIAARGTPSRFGRSPQIGPIGARHKRPGRAAPFGLSRGCSQPPLTGQTSAALSEQIYLIDSTRRQTGDHFGLSRPDILVGPEESFDFGRERSPCGSGIRRGVLSDAGALGPHDAASCRRPRQTARSMHRSKIATAAPNSIEFLKLLDARGSLSWVR
jgi:hypothetical protein